MRSHVDWGELPDYVTTAANAHQTSADRGIGGAAPALAGPVTSQHTLSAAAPDRESPAAPVSPAPSTAECADPSIAYCGGPLAGLVVGNESELVQPYGVYKRRYVREGNTMRWAKP